MRPVKEASARVDAPYPYIGLGLLDESSIEHDGEAWTARYLDQSGRLYLEVEVDAQHAELREFEVDGTPGIRTWRQTLNTAVVHHAAAAVQGNPSPLIKRLSQSGRLPLWVPLGFSDKDVRFTYSPAMAILRVVVPTPLGAPLAQPLPGPVAQRLGLKWGEDDASPLPGALFRFPPGAPNQGPEPIDLHVFTQPVVLLPELAFALEAANPPLPSAEWRPYLEGAFGLRRRSWSAPPRIGDHDPVPYAIGPLEDLAGPPVNEGITQIDPVRIFQSSDGAKAFADGLSAPTSHDADAAITEEALPSSRPFTVDDEDGAWVIPIRRAKQPAP